MTMLMTSLHRDYQPLWKVDWAIREIISNAIDGETRNAEEAKGQMSMAYEPKSKRLTVTNVNITVPAKSLLLGTSESRGKADCIGTFGEGLPMALLVLARNHYNVTIYNGQEKWEPSIEAHEILGEPVLCVKTRQMIKDRKHFSIEIEGIDADDYSTVQSMFLRFDPAFDDTKVIASPDGERVLLQSHHKNQIFNKGVFVCEKPKLLFGYDLRAELNRDRSMLDEWTLKNRLGTLLNEAVTNDEAKFLPILEVAVFEGNDTLELSDGYGDMKYNEKMKKHFALKFGERYGGYCIPVTSPVEAKEAEALGHKAIVCSPLLHSLVSTGYPSLAAIRSVQASKVERTIELSEEARSTLGRVLSKLPGDVSASLVIRPVEFGSAITKSIWRDGGIDIASSLFEDPAALLLSVVRELVIHGKLGSTSQDASADVAQALAKMILR